MARQLDYLPILKKECLFGSLSAYRLHELANMIGSILFSWLSLL